MKRLAIDLDGVLANFNEAFCRLNGLPEGFEHSTWEYAPELTYEQYEAGLQKCWEQENFFLKLFAYEGNVEALHEWVVCTDSDLYYVTSRHPTQGLSILVQSRLWLSHFDLFLANTSVVCVQKKEYKPAIYKALGISDSLDDCLDTVLEAEDIAGHRAWLLDRKWNRTGRPSEVLVVGSVKEWLEKVG